MGDSCPDLVTDVTVSEAEAILEPYFEAVRRRYLDSGLERVQNTRMTVRVWAHDSPRHFAACRDDGSEIVCAPHLVELAQELVVGILSHEFGHAVDFLYPGEFWLGRNDEVVRRSRESAESETAWLRSRRVWQDRDEEVVELVADGIASSVMGSPIGYQGPCYLESFTGGVPRPRGLR